MKLLNLLIGAFVLTIVFRFPPTIFTQESGKPVLPTKAKAQVAFRDGKCAHVRGSVGFDFPTPGAVVTFQNDFISQTVTTDANGEYEIVIPAGLYSMSVDVSPRLVYERATVSISCGRKNLVNFICTYSDSWASHYGGKQEKPIVYYYSPRERWLDDDRFETLIAFISEKESGEEIVYTRAVFTLNKFMISADEIRVNWKTRVVRAKGNVRFEYGKPQGSYSELVFEVGEPTSKVTGVQIIDKSIGRRFRILCQ